MQYRPRPLGQLDSQKKEVHIFGAGISGLLMAYFLKKHGLKVSVFEKTDRCGGKIATRHTQYGPAETAANAIYSNKNVIGLLKELKLDFLTAKKGLKRLIYYNGKIHQKPLSWYQLIFLVLKSLKKIPPQRTEQDCNLHDFLVPWMGEKLTNNVVSAGLRGIYAAEASKLHAWSILKMRPKSGQRYYQFFIKIMKIRKKEKSGHKASSISFEKGMQSFINALEEQLKENIHFNTSKELDPKMNSIICTNAHEAAELLQKSNPEAADKLKSISYTAISTTTLFTKEQIPELKHSFGLLQSPTSKKLSSMGILNNNEIFNHRVTSAQGASYTFISKELTGPIDSAKSDLEYLSTSTVSLFDSRSTTWQKAIPLYDFQRYKTVNELQSIFHNKKGLVLFGNYLGGISIREMISMAKSFAQESHLN